MENSSQGVTIPASIDVQELAREIAMRMAPDALLDAADVGAMLKCSAQYVTEEFAHAPGFPKTIRLTRPEGRRGKPRWLRSDVVAWIEAHRGGRSTRGGRPRNSTDE